jgi:alkylhydroperoxidase family enzyme
VEFLRVASGGSAASLAVLGGEEESLSPRQRALARLAVALTARPWEVTSETIADLRHHGLDEGQIETAVGVSAMFNYFTRVADATGIEFDYPTPLPAFEPDVCQVAAARPARPGEAGQGAVGPDAAGRPVPAAPKLRTLWDAWHSFLLEADESLSTGQRRLVAAVAAGESGDWERAAELSSRALPASAGGPLPAFARKLSRAPWSMTAGDLDALRAAGHTEHAALHVVAIVAHQNADSRLAAGLRAARAAGRG